MGEEFVMYRNSHKWGRPTGLCLICGKSPFPLVHDHCHRHGWLRGAIGVGICNPCNGTMQAVDRGALPGPYHRAPEDAYIQHWSARAMVRSVRDRALRGRDGPAGAAVDTDGARGRTYRISSSLWPCPPTRSPPATARMPVLVP